MRKMKENPLSLKETQIGVAFYRLVLHLQKAFLELQNFQTAVALSRQSFQPQPHHRLRFGSAESFYRRAEEITEINR